jgi:Ca2+/Na+ antiporter
MLLVDLAAIALLTVAVYFHRHRRRDLVVAFFGVNIGVFAVSNVLASAEVAAGLGLGLFGVLSIIRLRSSEISQREVAYYFAALAIGLLTGLAQTFDMLSTLLVGVVVLTLAVIDHPALFSSYRHRTVQLDEAIGDDDVLREALEERLGGEVRALSVQHVDFVNDTTLVDVRYRVRRDAATSGERLAARQELAA